MPELARQIDEAVAAIRGRWPDRPRVGIILGTGLGAFTDEIAQQAAPPYDEIPHFPRATAPGHAGQLVCGRVAGVSVIAMDGRFHRYEGHPLQLITLPVRVMQALGIELLIVSNASGGLNPAYDVGDIVVIDDHINLMGDNPLIGPNDDRLGPRFPDMSQPYDRDLVRRALDIARRSDVVAHRGVYVAVTGPCYETRAEYRYLRSIGGDVVGMSTAPEVIVAAHMGLKVLALSAVTNVCRPDALQAVDGQSVLAAAQRVEPNMRKIVLGILADLAADRNGQPADALTAQPRGEASNTAPPPRGEASNIAHTKPDGSGLASAQPPGGGASNTSQPPGGRAVIAPPSASSGPASVVSAPQIIARKRDGLALSADEIGDLVRGYVAGEIPDYQMSAWTMAVCWRGMTPAETFALTEAMLASGATLDVGDPAGRVDKHSTGGLGDKTSFIVAPLLACCGLQVPMISGRGLGATGGTIDKLESIPGLRTDLSTDEIRRIVDQVGCVITAATADLVPADRKLYALRDVTATVPSIPLITASILSKKLAENLSSLVLDVKFGSGAFMKTRALAQALAESMVEVGARKGVKTAAVITTMDQPHGRLVGNAVEIDESLETLAGGGPADLRELALELTAEALLTEGAAASLAQARTTLAGHLDSGRALEKFEQMIRAQGGSLARPRPRAPGWTLTAKRDGYLTAMNAEGLGMAVVEMGGGRKKIGQPIDHAVGLEMLARLGDRVKRGQPLLVVFASPAARERALPLIECSLEIGDAEPTIPPLVVDRVRSRQLASR